LLFLHDLGDRADNQSDCEFTDQENSYGGGYLDAEVNSQIHAFVLQ
jgi:hypothetical protein